LVGAVGVSDQNSETSIYQQEVTMGSRKMLLTTVMVGLLALPLAACSGTASVRTSRLCTAAGGTYNGTTRTCNPGTPNTKGAKQICDAHGGVYDDVLDMCNMPGTK
jgi:hypothetical protein